MLEELTLVSTEQGYRPKESKSYRFQRERSRNRTLNIKEYNDGALYLYSRPRYVMMELTRGCNLRCPMCRPKVLSPRGRSMPYALFRYIGEELFPFAEIVDLRGWGESLILKNIDQLIKETAAFGTKIRFVTNLSFCRDKILEILAEHRCLIGVSLDSADALVLKNIRGGANLELIINNIRILTAAYNKRYGTTRDIYITCTVQEPALSGLADLVDLAADCSICEIRLFTVSMDSSNPMALEYHQDAVDKALDSMRERAVKRGVDLVAATRLGTMHGNLQNMPPCIHPWCYVYISYDGQVGFCDHLIGYEGEAFLLGSLYTQTFETIWNGMKWRKLRKQHMNERKNKSPLFIECEWCYRNRFIDFEYCFFNSRRGSRHHLIES